MDGTVPHLAKLPPGCAFGPRCPVVFEPCDQEVPTLQLVGPVENARSSHRTACYKNDAVREAMSTTTSVAR